MPSLSVIMGFTGAIMGTLLGFVYPAAFYLRLVDDRDRARTRRAAWALLVLGVVFGVVCFAAQIWSMVT